MEDFGVVSGALGAAPAVRAPTSYTSWDTKLRSAGFSSNLGSSSSINWSDLASGALGSKPLGTGAFDAGSYFPTPAKKAPPATPPERFDVKYPVSRYGVPPPAPKLSTQGDVFGSVLGAAGDTAGSLNLANVVPWFMERVNVLANEFSKADIPVVSDLARFAHPAFDLFSAGVKAAADVAAPILNALPDLVMNGQLHDRARLYRSIVNGTAADFGPLGPMSNPLGTVAQYGAEVLGGGFLFNLLGDPTGGPVVQAATGIFGKPVSAQDYEYEQYRKLLLHTIDPNGRATIEQRMGVLREAIDIPPSVKIALERNPNMTDAQIEDALAKAPEGRSWSYQGGIPGVVQNMGTSLLFYLSEARALGLAGQGIGALGKGMLGARPAIGALGLARGAGTAAQYGGSVIARAGQVTSAAAKVQTYFMAAGLGATGLTTTMDAVARVIGDQAAIDWFDRVNRTTKFSDDPAVQLVTSFTVNPFQAFKIAKAGTRATVGAVAHPIATARSAVGLAPGRATLALANGLGDLSLSAETAGRMQRFVANDAQMVDMVARMYGGSGRLSDAEAVKFIDANYANKGEAFNEVLGVALEEVVGRLHDNVRAVIAATHPDPIAYTRFVAQTYADSAMKLLETDAQAVAKRWQERSWAYHNYPGRFSPEVAAANARDIRIAKERTYKLRAELNAVVGYREYLPPQGQALARAKLDAMTLPDGTIAVEGLNGVQGLIKDFPALQKHWTGLITTETHIPRASVERMIERAQADWQRVTHQNPVKARTGADPILRPNSPTLTRDTADALGTSIETLNAIDEGAATADGLASIRRFLVDKLSRTPEQAAAMTAEEAVVAAQKYVADTTAPWRRAGESVVAAEKDMASLRSELARLHALPKGVVQPDEIIRLERQLAAVNTLVRASSDPIVPFVSEVATAKLGGRGPSAARIRAMDAATLTEKDVSFLRTFLNNNSVLTEGKAPSSLLAAAKGIIDRTPYGQGRDIALTELASRRAEATTQLNELQVIHDAASAIAGDEWHTMFRRVDGQVQYSGGLPAMSESMRRALHFEGMGDYEAWANLANRFDQVEHLLTRAQRRAAHSVLDDGRWKYAGPDQLASHGLGRAVEETGPGSSAIAGGSLVERLASLWAEREAILGGTSEYALRRTADLQLPAQYAALADEMAATGSVERGVIHDPQFAKRIHPANVARLEDSLAKPETYPAAREIIDADPILADRFAAFMQREGLIAGHGVDAAQVAREAVAPGDVWAVPPGRTSHLAGTAKGDIARAKTAAWADLKAPRDGPPPLDSRLTRAKDGGWVVEERRPASADPHSPWYVEPAPASVPAEAHIDLHDGTRVNFTYDVLGDSAYAGMVREALIPPGFVRPVPGVIVPDGMWDQAILANDKPALEQLARDFKLDETPAAPVSAPARVARQAAVNVPKRRPSVRYARRLNEADNTISPDPAVMAAPANRIGMDVLSVMNQGIAGTQPATVNRVLELLREIENGTAKRAGIGDDLAAEAQRVANEILDEAVKVAPRADTTGIFTRGIFPEDEMSLAGEIDALMKYDEANPLGTLQYGLKKRPKDAVVLEWSQVPGLAEELMSRRYQGFPERLGAAQARQFYNYVFGPRSNAAIKAESKVRFLERAAQQGVDGQTASAIHDAWRTAAKESRSDVLRRTPTGERRYVSGDNPLYADVPNLPNAKLDAIAHQTINDLLDAGKIDATDFYVRALHQVDYAAMFRESSSFIRRTLADHGGKLGDDLARVYGMAAHNKAATTTYYWFRFGLDIRFHAMNYLEAQFLYLGRAGLKKGEISQGQLGMTEQWLRNLDSDPMSNTGYQFTQDRMAMAYRTFLKEQPDVLRAKLTGLQAEHPEFMQRALDQLAEHDPQIRDMRLQFGDDAAKYLNELDAWHQKMLDAASMDETVAAIDEGLAQAYRDSPELAQLYARLGDANMELWDNVRSTFYGNPARSRAERFLNSYLLFWPLSYQIKSTKWFAKVLLDRAGGIQTNAGGAYLFDQMAQTHQRLLATDPEYQSWFEKHPTLVFLAQMLFPVSFEGTGVSLNPAMRSLFFGRAKGIWDIGPVYTFRHVVPPLMKEAYADLYPTLKDVPGFDGLYRATSGAAKPRQPNEPVGMKPYTVRELWADLTGAKPKPADSQAGGSTEPKLDAATLSQP